MKQYSLSFRMNDAESSELEVHVSSEESLDREKLIKYLEGKEIQNENNLIGPLFAQAISVIQLVPNSTFENMRFDGWNRSGRNTSAGYVSISHMKFDSLEDLS